MGTADGLGQHTTVVTKLIKLSDITAIPNRRDRDIERVSRFSP